jgi:hypothetical protein
MLLSKFHDYVHVDEQGVKHWKNISISIEQIEEKHHLNMVVRKKGLVFAKCIVCESIRI